VDVVCQSCFGVAVLIYDVAIVGGGMVGLAFACRLAAQQDLQVLVLDQTNNSRSRRVSALNLSSQAFLQKIDVWSQLSADHISPYTRMHVWDDLHQGEIDFDATASRLDVLGYIVDNDAMQHALLAKAKANPNITLVTNVSFKTLARSADHISLVTNEQTWQAKLAVGADGARSQLREAAGIGVERKDYEEQGLIATVQCDRPLQQTAYQVFLETGPLAFLPLAAANSGLASIVWSLPTHLMPAMLELDETNFNALLTSKMAGKVGAITHSEGRASFPLFQQQATTYIADRVALIGDAAHTVHPLAGQGLNRGFADAGHLAEALWIASKKGREIGCQRDLRYYERAAKAEQAMWTAGIDGIHALFAAKHTLWQRCRSRGLSMVNGIAPLKRLLVRTAVGNIARV